MDKFDRTAKNALGFLDNEYVSAALSVFLIIYAGLAAPALPVSVARLFDNVFFKVLIFFLIAYVGNKNPTVSLIAAIGLLISLQTLNRYQVAERIQNAYSGATRSVGEDEDEDDETTEDEQEVSVEALLPEAGETDEATVQEMEMEAADAEDANLVEGMDSNAVTKKYRNSAYHQYVNMEPNQYKDRNAAQPVGAWESGPNFATI